MNLENNLEYLRKGPQRASSDNQQILFYAQSVVKRDKKSQIGKLSLQEDVEALNGNRQLLPVGRESSREAGPLICSCSFLFSVVRTFE